MSYSKITITNSLQEGIVVYDAFQNDAQDKNLSNFFGTLTSISKVAAGANQTFEPIHGPISTYIVYDNNYNPITRVFSMGIEAQTFTVTEADVAIMNSTNAFIKLLQDSPSDPQCVAFQAILKGGKGTSKKVNDFFKGTTDYQTCTFISYMLAVVAIARTPETKNKPPQQQVYSLSSLAKYMGFDWPPGIPDVTVSNFNCSENSEAIMVGGKLNINDVTLADGVLAHVLSFLPSPEITFGIEFVYDGGLATGSTCLKFTLDDIKIPIGGGKTFDIDQPTILLSLNPLFKFVVFEVKAEIPFNIFKSPTIDADIAMTIDNIEAEVGVNLKGNTTSLLTPPGIKGLHFDSFGVGLGVIFEPPGFAIGVEGTFHIGNKGQVPLTDDKFAIICEMEEEVPNPVYLSFYVPKLDLSELITLFTNTTINLDLPVSFQDLSFTWAENLMEPLVLPDGSLTKVGYGFSAYMSILDLQFYGYLQIDLSSGISGDITMSPLSFGKLLKLTGNGKAINLKYDVNGNPIPNNTIPKTAAEKKVIANATSKQIIAAGGPSMTLSTSSSPYFSLDAEISLFELVNEKIDAEISKDGISFELDYGAVMETKMQCRLEDYHNFSGKFTYGIDLNVPLPSVAGFSLGSIDLDAACDLGLAISTSTSDVRFGVQGGFTFEGLDLSFGPFNADVNINSISALIDAVGKYVLVHAGDIFKAFILNASKWAGFVKNEVIKGVKDVAQGLKTAFNQSETEVASIMHGVGYGVDEIASGIQNAFSASANEIATALKDGIGASDTVVTAALKGIGFGVQDIATALNSVFGLAPTAIKDILSAAGFADSAIESAFNAIGGAFASAAKSIWHAVTHWDHW
ncbi:hypothetical protein [Marivirga arenosa]|uniref:Uncharacterized protein n=1 Tax=Marivirga arenosa TaxID=3059076 RepID=A0AA49JD86_9BACT|nr:hypothetical protein [Marivirga sp. BKB1-2]WKK82292.2 hypothetical protein QYS47_09400 [Marivirga sp. BKB1-2]